ncbi:single-stranded DNA-binding protein [Undibacterium sp. TJN25]|uniref:single-stranded DNA-binding protein n=1 Tax=Undibacterium sp. TJN25 TaxID=3413056 RepID=UPI003BEF523C
MSTTAPAGNPNEARKEPTPMRVFVKGRIEETRQYEGNRFTRILTPAPDAYSRPQVVEVKSKGRLGQKGDDVSVVCALGGYQRKPFQMKDKDSGEVLKIIPVDHTLEAVETQG